MNQKNRYLPFLFAFVWGIPLFLFGSCEILARATIEVSGKVQGAQIQCMQPANNRCATTYVLESPGGKMTNHVAGSVDHALARNIPLGATIEKKKWQLDYQVDDKTVNDFPLLFYLLACTIGGLVFTFGLGIGFKRVISRQTNIVATK